MGACALALLMHFLFIGLYTFPGTPAPQVVHAAAREYSFPMFHQGWRLFAPNLREFDNKLEYRSAVQGEWSDWQKPGLMEYDADRLAYFSNKIAMKLHNTCNAKEGGIYYIDDVPRTDAVEKSTDFVRAAYMCFKHWNYYHENSPDSIQLRLNYRFMPGADGTPANEDLQFTFNPYDTRTD